MGRVAVPVFVRKNLEMWQIFVDKGLPIMYNIKYEERKLLLYLVVIDKMFSINDMPVN